MIERNYNEATEYIESIPMFGPRTDGRSKSGNENLSDIMSRLGNPEKKINAIHIAGTNGKGSTAQFVADILCAKGYRVGVFTSPHLMKINERISIHEPALEDTDNAIHSVDISDEAFADCFNIVMAKVDEAVADGRLHISYFECLFAIAAVYYDMEKPDYVVYETGLGGRLDATCLLSPVVTAITSIGLDHTKYLGTTIRDIAWEKAGIIKENIPVIYNTGEPEADMVIEAQAELLHSRAINVAKTEYIINEFTDKTIDFSLHNRYYKYSGLLLTGGLGLYQVDNAMTAIEVCNTIFEGNPISHEDIQSGLSSFSWQGRMEKIHENIVMDGAHNPDAIDRFIESVNAVYAGRDKRLLFAVAGDKDYEPMILQICENLTLSEIYVTSLDSGRGISAEYIAGLFSMYLARQPEGKHTAVYSDDNIRSTFLKSVQSVKNTDGILFCVGSLYLIGSLKKIAAEDLHI